MHSDPRRMRLGEVKVRFDIKYHIMIWQIPCLTRSNNFGKMIENIREMISGKFQMGKVSNIISESKTLKKLAKLSTKHLNIDKEIFSEKHH